MNQPLEMTFGKTLHCLEVLQSLQTNNRTSGWYWGDVRGKRSIGAATGALCRKDLICSSVGPPPFRLTPKGEAFLKTNKKEWEAFLANTDHSATVEHFTRAFTQIPETHEARDSQ